MKEIEAKFKDGYEKDMSSNHKVSTVYREWKSDIRTIEFKDLSPDFVKWFSSKEDASQGNLLSVYVGFSESEKEEIKKNLNNISFTLWLNICRYLFSTKEEEKISILEKIKIGLTELTKSIKDPSGKGMLPMSIADGAIVRNVYLAEDKNLTDLFAEFLPRPSASLFAAPRIPKLIMDIEAQVTKSVQDVIERSDGDVKKVESAAITIQRALRASKLQKERVLLFRGLYQLKPRF